MHTVVLVLLSLSSMLSVSSAPASTETYPREPYGAGEPFPFRSALRFSGLRIRRPNPELIRNLDATNSLLLLTVPNNLIKSMASSHRLAMGWVRDHVLASSKIAMISVGEDVAVSDLRYLADAIRSVNLALVTLEIHGIEVSTTFSSTKVVATAFPPSAAEFHKMLNELRFQVPPGPALFQGGRLIYYVDSGTRYSNFFDMTVDAFVTSLGKAGFGNLVRLVVAGSGWPDEKGSMDWDVHPQHAEVYLKALPRILMMSDGETPLSKRGIVQAFLFDVVEGPGYSGWIPPALREDYHLESPCTTELPDEMPGGWSISWPFCFTALCVIVAVWRKRRVAQSGGTQ